MPDETKPGQDAAGGQDAQKTSSAAQSNEAGKAQASGDRVEDLPKWAQDKLAEYRRENEGWRKKLEETDAAAKQREQARLIEEGKWKELAETRAAELAKLSPYQERATTLEKMISENNIRLIQQMPEQYRVLVPKGAPEEVAAWLATSLPILAAPKAADLNAGEGSGSKAPLTEEDRMNMKRSGMNEEQWRAAKAAAGQ